MYLPQLLGRLLLQFDSKSAEVPDDLSAATSTPDGSIWVVSDEHHELERFSAVGPRTYGNHQRYSVPELLGKELKEETDIEALDFQDGHFWLVGSHSAVRKKPKGKGTADDLERLARVRHQPSRFLLARVPVPGDTPSEKKAARQESPAWLRSAGDKDDGVNVLVELLRKDPHLGPFLAPASSEDPHGALAIPSKDNGLDIEGLAVHGDSVFLGLRGPVLRGYAVLLELKVGDAGNGVLEPRHQKKGGWFRKHFLDLDGLGIRELCRHGKDLLILAGPTLPLDGAIRLYRLVNGLELQGDTLHQQAPGVLEPLFDVPHSLKSDRAEGVTLFSWFEPGDSVLVVYDTPSKARRQGPCGVLADVFRLGQT